MFLLDIFTNFAVPAIYIFLIANILSNILALSASEIYDPKFKIVTMLKCLDVILGIFIVIGIICTFIKTRTIISVVLCFTENKPLIFLVIIALIIEIIKNKKFETKTV